MTKWLSSHNLKIAAIFCTIPLIAAIIAARQGYLNAYYHLSTWKGGGMGMFAGADSGDTRFTRIFIETADGKRQPIVKLLPAQSRQLQKAIWYPTRANFEPLAMSLRTTSFVASNEASKVYKIDNTKRTREAMEQSLYLLHARGPRPGGDDADWTLVIEYWEISYDGSKREARATLTETMRFDKGAGT